MDEFIVQAGMFVRSSNFFHDCENNHEWDSKTKSSISLPSSLSSISFSSSYNPTDSLLFSAPDWNKNLVQLFQEFNECVDSFHQDVEEHRKNLNNTPMNITDRQSKQLFFKNNIRSQLDETFMLTQHRQPEALDPNKSVSETSTSSDMNHHHDRKENEYISSEKRNLRELQSEREKNNAADFQLSIASPIHCTDPNKFKCIPPEEVENHSQNNSAIPVNLWNVDESKLEYFAKNITIEQTNGPVLYDSHIHRRVLQISNYNTSEEVVNCTENSVFASQDARIGDKYDIRYMAYRKQNSGNNEKKRTPDPLSNQTDSSQISERQRHILARIVDLLYLIEQSVDKAVPLTVRRKPRWNTCSMKDGILQLNDNAKRKKNIKPINTRRLQLIVRMLASIHQLLVTNSSCTKRELYYLHVELAQTPAYAYSTLDDICALLDVDAWEMNIFNTSKGLIAGPMMLKLNSGHTIDCNIRWGTSVPLDVGSVVDIQFSAKLVLVVEKDTVFKRLLQDGLLDKYPSTFVLITGKGYPDISTRLLLKKIADFSKAPIFGLMDADPHGIEIFCVYKYGALAMAHRQQSLAIPSMRWIGLFPSDIELLGLQGVALKEPELRRIGHIIKRPYTEDLIQRELLLLRQLGFKAEIESLYNIASDFLVSVYLKGKLKNFMYLLENTENIIQIVKYRYGKCPS